MRGNTKRPLAHTPSTPNKKSLSSVPHVVPVQVITPQQRHIFSNTPWSYWTEWNHVYSLLFSPLPHLQRLGVSRVSAWRSRGSLPVAVESTAALVESKLADMGNVEEGTKHSATAQSITLLYSCAIARLVNGILEAKQIAHHPVPLTLLALENTFPQSLVDLRHQVSHFSDLPSIHILRQGADVGLTWLRTMYWDRQTNALHGLRQSIAHALVKYRELMLGLLADKQSMPGLFSENLQTTSSVNDVSEIESITRIASVKRCIEEITGIANPNLVQEVLVPLLVSASDYHFLLPPGKYVDFAVPQGQVLLWHIAIRKFAHVWVHFSGSLLLTLVNQIVDTTQDDGALDDKDRREYHLNSLRTAWIVHILRNYYFHPSASSTTAPVTGPLISIANVCLKHMNIWTKYILAHICGSDNSNTTQTQWEEMKELAALKRFADALCERNWNEIDDPVTEALNFENIPNTRDNTLNEIEQLIKIPDSAVAMNTTQECLWTISPNYPTSTPIGVLPNGDFPNLDLPSSLDQLQQGRFLVTASNQPAFLATEPDTSANSNLNRAALPALTAELASTDVIGNVGENNDEHHDYNDEHHDYNDEHHDYNDEHQDEGVDEILEVSKHDIVTVNNLFIHYKELFV